MLSLVTVVLITTQLGSLTAVDQAVARYPYMAAAYAKRAGMQFSVRQLLGLTTVAAVVVAGVAALSLPWQLGALFAGTLAVQSATIGGYSVWRRCRSRLKLQTAAPGEPRHDP